MNTIISYTTRLNDRRREWPKTLNSLLVVGALALAFVLGPILVSETKLPFAIMMALIAGAWIVRFPFAGLLVFLAFISLEELLSVIPSLTFVKLMGPALFGAYLVQKDMRQIRRLIVPDALRAAFVWVAYGGLSLAWSLRPDLSLSRLITEVQLLVLALLVVNMLDTPAKARKALLTFGFVMVFGVVLGIRAVSVGIDYRAVISGAQSATTFASIMGAGGAVFGALALYGSLRARWLYITMVIISILGVLAAAGRGTLVSLSAVALVLIWSRPKLPSKLAAAFSIIALLGITSWVIMDKTSIINPTALYRLTSEASLEGGVQYRLAIVKAFVLRVFPRRPLFGYGLSTAHIAHSLTPSARLLTRGYIVDAHNDLVQVLIDLGLIGLILWLAVYWKLWQELVRLRETAARHNMLDLYWAAVCLVVQVFINNLSSTYLWEKRVWFALAFAMAVAKLLKNADVMEQDSGLEAA